MMGKIRHKAIQEVGVAEVIAVSELAVIGEINSLPNLSHQEIIHHDDLDAIVICTPNFLNQRLTIEALNAGKTCIL